MWIVIEKPCIAPIDEYSGARIYEYEEALSSYFAAALILVAVFVDVSAADVMLALERYFKNSRAAIVNRHKEANHVSSTLCFQSWYGCSPLACAALLLTTTFFLLVSILHSG